MTNKKLRDLEKKIHEIYDEALQDSAEKLADYLDRYEEQREKKLSLLESGDLDEKEYNEWLNSQAYAEKHHRTMVNTLSQDAYNTNKIAAQMINGHMLDVYALNANYAAFSIDNLVGFFTSFSLYNRYTVELLIRDNPDLLPDVNPNKRKDIKWNKKKFNNEITQGILQGESIPKMAKRLERVMNMNKNTAIRNARTATTSAQNKGRLSSYKRAESIGVELKKMWVAALDNRTRHSHRLLDGQVRELDKPFESIYGKISEPGDKNAHPADVYNCRCKIIAPTKYSTYDPKDLSNRFSRLPSGTTYEEWQNMEDIVNG